MHDKPRLLTSMVTVMVAFVLSTLPSAAQDDVEDLIFEAQEALVGKDHTKAVRLFEKADQASANDSIEILLGLAESLNGIGAHKDAVAAARRGIQASPETDDLVRLTNQEAKGLFELAGIDAAALEKAAVAYGRILELTEGLEPVTHYNLGVLRMRQGRDAEGRTSLEQYLALSPNGRFADVAKALIDNPRRAREALVPDVSLVTLDGEHMTFEELRGKVVLVDFWATWCSPCIAAMPTLRRLSKRSAKSPFVLVSISIDSDRAALDRMIEEHRMVWPQVWDEYGQLARKSFAVQRFPTYLVVDHEGVIVSRLSGWGTNIERQLMGDIAGAVRRAKKAASGQ